MHFPSIADIVPASQLRTKFSPRCPDALLISWTAPTTSLPLLPLSRLRLVYFAKPSILPPSPLCEIQYLTLYLRARSRNNLRESEKHVIQQADEKLVDTFDNYNFTVL